MTGRIAAAALAGVVLGWGRATPALACGDPDECLCVETVVNVIEKASGASLDLPTQIEICPELF